MINATLQGHDALFILDSGAAGELTLSRSFAWLNRDILGDKSALVDSSSWAGNWLTSYRVKVSQFCVAGKTVAHVRASIPKDVNGGDSIGGFIGLTILGNSRLTVDFPHRQLWIEWLEPQKLGNLLAQLGPIDSRDLCGDRPLTLACLMQRDDAVQALLDAHANPNLPSNTGITPLMIAAATGREKLVSTLLAKQADPNAHDSSRGYTPLDIAVVAESPEVVSALIKAGSHVDSLVADFGTRRTPLSLAAETGNVEITRLLLNQGAEVDLCYPDTATALSYACTSRNPDCVKLLLDHGADPNAHGRLSSPLSLASAYGEPEIMKLLLRRGARVDDEVGDGTNPLIQAVIGQNEPEPVQIFRCRGADPSHHCKVGTPISRALQTGNSAALKMLLDYQETHAAGHPATVPSKP